MSAREFLCRKVKHLTRPQKRLILLSVDMQVTVISSYLVLVVSGGIEVANAWPLIAGLAMMSVAFSARLGLPRIKLNAYERRGVLLTAKFACLMVFGLAVACQMSISPLTLVAAAEFGFLVFLGAVTSRYAMLTALLWTLRKEKSVRRVFIYGAGDTGLQMALALRNHQGILPVAFLDDDPDLQAISVAGLPVLSPNRLEDLLRKWAVDRVLLAMPSASVAKLALITRKLNALGLDVQALPSFAQLTGTEALYDPSPSAAAGQFLGRSALNSDMPDVSHAYCGKVVLVSGAGGSVGSELCRQLITHRPRSLVLFEQSEIALYTIDQDLRRLALGGEIEIVPVLGSVADWRMAKRTFDELKVDVVFHAAAYKHVPLVEANPVAGLATNFVGTRSFAEAAAAKGVTKFVLISTDKAVRPTSVMGATKRLAELVIHDLAKRSAGCQFSTVRFGNVLGSSGSVVPLFRGQIARGGPVTLTHNEVTRYFMTLAEAARLVLMAGAFSQKESGGNIFVLDMGRPVKIRDLAERMIKAEGLSICDRSTPDGDIEIMVTGLRPGEKLHEELLIDGQILQTPHQKILCAKETGLSEFAMAAALNAARIAIDAGDQAAARAMITTWVEGFPAQDIAAKTPTCAGMV
jgi:FlaA1/EpsC-like NDP-sugar epimerase